MLHFPASPFQVFKTWNASKRGRIPIRKSRGLRPRAPNPGLSWLATSFFGPRAEPSTKRRSSGRKPLNPKDPMVVSFFMPLKDSSFFITSVNFLNHWRRPSPFSFLLKGCINASKVSSLIIKFSERLAASSSQL